MRPADNIEESIKKLRYKTNAETHKKVLGNVLQTPLDDIWKQFEPASSDLVKTLFNLGPAGLLDDAVRMGYKKARLYADKCHLCTDIRQFLLDNGAHQSVLGPPECYR